MAKTPLVKPPGAVERLGSFIEKWLEAALFGSRWLMAPFYVGLIGALLILLAVFFQEMLHELPLFLSGKAKAEDAILLALSLIDLSLAANLVLIVIFSGYENFVSKINTGDHEDRPTWMGSVDFSGLKMKLIGSIVAISAISLLRAFMELNEEGSVMDEARMRWMLILHMAFVGSGLLFAVMDYIGNRAEKPSGH